MPLYYWLDVFQSTYHTQLGSVKKDSCYIPNSIPEWNEFSRPREHFMKLVITDNLSFTDYYHGNSQWRCFIANQNQECHCTCQWMTNCQWWQVSWIAPLKVNMAMSWSMWSRQAIVKFITLHAMVTGSEHWTDLVLQSQVDFILKYAPK